MPWWAAGASVLGGALGAFGGDKTSKPPKWLTRAQSGNVANAQQIANTPQQYYPNQTFVGGLPSEQNAFGMQSNYNNQMFGQPSYGGGFDPLQAGGTQGYSGGSQGSPFGNVLGSMNSQLTGQNAQGGMTSQIAPFATSQIGQSFQGPSQINPYQYQPNFGQAGGLDARGTLASMMGGQQGTYGNLASAANSQMGQFGQAGNLDATNAYQQALSGQGDYSTLQSNIEAANAPILRQLNQEIIPGLNSRATFLNNGTGGIKTLNKVLPEVADRMSQNATGSVRRGTAEGSSVPAERHGTGWERRTSAGFTDVLADVWSGDAGHAGPFQCRGTGFLWRSLGLRSGFAGFGDEREQSKSVPIGHFGSRKPRCRFGERPINFSSENGCAVPLDLPGRKTALNGCRGLRAVR